MKFIFHGLCLLAALFSPRYSWPKPAQEVIRNAKIFSLNSGEKSLFTQVSHFTTDSQGITREETTIRDPEGNLALTQNSTFKGEELLSQQVQQLQTHKKFTVQANGKHVTFTEENLVGPPDKKTEEKDVDGIFLTGPVTEEFVRAHWAELMKGDTLYVRFGVLEISDTVGFKFFKADSNSHEVCIRMKPSSIFIAMGVSSIDITFDLQTRRMTHFKGRTPLRISKEDKLEPLDGEITYN